MWDYKVIGLPRDIDIIGNSVSGAKNYSEAIAACLEQTMNRMAAQGWEFYRTGTVHIVEKPGCLGGLIGLSEIGLRYSALTFRKARPA